MITSSRKNSLLHFYFIRIFALQFKKNTANMAIIIIFQIYEFGSVSTLIIYIYVYDFPLTYYQICLSIFIYLFCLSIFAYLSIFVYLLIRFVYSYIYHRFTCNSFFHLFVKECIFFHFYHGNKSHTLISIILI